jgi:hypothetical protein
MDPFRTIGAMTDKTYKGVPKRLLGLCLVLYEVSDLWALLSDAFCIAWRAVVDW